MRRGLDLSPNAALARMDGNIVEVLAWSEVLRAVGSAPDLIDPRGMSVLGNALTALAELLRDDFGLLHEALTSTARS